jgi:hypothetical protein
MNISKNYGPGLVFIGIAFYFGISTLINYPVGQFAKPGPGFFPAILSIFLFCIGIISILTSKKKEAAYIDVTTAAIVVASLVLFAVCTMLANMVTGIVAMTVTASFAVKEKFSWYKTAKITFILVLAAIFFKYVLGLKIPLWT